MSCRHGLANIDVILGLAPVQPCPERGEAGDVILKAWGMRIFRRSGIQEW
jgi:hypothetical protein